MKKVVALLCVLFVLVPTCFAEGEIDFSGYSLEELLRIKTDLSNELASRPGAEPMILTPGDYTIGEDFPAGVYSFRFLQNGDEEVERSDYYVYENESMYRYDVDRWWLGDLPRLDGSLKGTADTKLTLYPGELLSIRYNGAEVERVGNAPEVADDYSAPEGTTIPKGNYTIGEEIPAGTYRIYSGAATTSRVRIFADFEESDNMFNHGNEIILNSDNREAVVTLEDGNILRVEYTQIVMTKGGFSFD